MTVRISRSFSSPTVTFYLEADVTSTQWPGGAGYGRWLVQFRLNMSKASGSYYADSGIQAGRGNNVEFGRVSQTPFLPSGTTSWSRTWTRWVNANSNGYWSGSSTTYPLQMHLVYGSIADSSNGSVALPRIAQLPAKPVNAVYQSATTTSLSFRISAPANGGSTITTYNHQISKDSNFPGGLPVDGLSWNSGASNQVASPLDPGTTYYYRYRAVNGRGAGPWSTAVSGTTLPASAPGMVVAPSLSGTSATITLTGPGSTQASSYRVERRIGTGAATVFNGSSPMTIGGLAPGTAYQWRASAFIGSYQSPWTAWTTVVQPRPNTSPGDYFDGSSAATEDTTYQWDGTANNSTSSAIGHLPMGWEVVAAGDDVAVGQRVTGGLFGQFGARLTFITDATSPDTTIGMSTSDGLSAVADTAEGGVYSVSMFVRPSREQRLVLEVVWLDASGAAFSTSVGESMLVSNTTDWTRLSATLPAPVGGEGAALRVRAANDGPGYTPWLSGDSVDVDAAMVSVGVLYPYFDGSFANTSAYEYLWLGTPNASASQRLDVEQDAVDPLLDPDCPPIPSAPLPPSIDDSCIETVGTWRRYWAILPETEVFDWLTVVPTIVVTVGEFAVRQVRIRFWPNPESLAPENASGLAFESEQVISYIPANTVLTLDGVSRRAWASVGGAAEIPAGHLLYGTNGGPATWPTLSCGSAYLVSFDVPLEEPVGNMQGDISLTTRML